MPDKIVSALTVSVTVTPSGVTLELPEPRHGDDRITYVLRNTGVADVALVQQVSDTHGVPVPAGGTTISEDWRLAAGPPRILKKTGPETGNPIVEVAIILDEVG